MLGKFASFCIVFRCSKRVERTQNRSLAGKEKLMKNLLKKSSPVAWFLLGVLVAGGTGTANAANGGTFKLGASNSATKTTTLTNTTGTALRLNSPSTKAPLSVGTNKTKVPSLNADLLDGKDSSAFQPKLASTLTFENVTLAAGWGYGTGNCSPDPGPQVAKTAEGIVYMKGSVCYSGGGSAVMFTLPAAYIPANRVFVPVLVDGPAVGAIEITTAGAVIAIDAGSPGSAGRFTSLTGVTYALPN